MVVPDIAQSNDVLLIQVDPGMTPMCTFVPRQLNKDQMMSLFPELWIDVSFPRIMDYEI